MSCKSCLPPERESERGGGEGGMREREREGGREGREGDVCVYGEICLGRLSRSDMTSEPRYNTRANTQQERARQSTGERDAGSVYGIAIMQTAYEFQQTIYIMHQTRPCLYCQFFDFIGINYTASSLYSFV